MPPVLQGSGILAHLPPSCCAATDHHGLPFLVFSSKRGSFTASFARFKAGVHSLLRMCKEILGCSVYWGAQYLSALKEGIENSKLL